MYEMNELPYATPPVHRMMEWATRVLTYAFEEKYAFPQLLGVIFYCRNGLDPLEEVKRRPNFII